MQPIIIAFSLCIVILSNCLLYEARSMFLMDPRVISKRSMERRSFIKSFCARRCNIGKGGNVCRCNGFHFAGKRTSNPPLESEHYVNDKDSADEEMLYKILEQTHKIRMLHGQQVDTAAPEDMLLEQINDLLPDIITDESRYVCLDNPS